MNEEFAANQGEEQIAEVTSFSLNGLSPQSAHSKGGYRGSEVNTHTDTCSHKRFMFCIRVSTVLLESLHFIHLFSFRFFPHFSSSSADVPCEQCCVSVCLSLFRSLCPSLSYHQVVGLHCPQESYQSYWCLWMMLPAKKKPVSMRVIHLLKFGSVRIFLFLKSLLLTKAAFIW